MSGGVNKIWAAFRRWPVKTRVVIGVLAGLLALGAIGSATSPGTHKASSVTALGPSETTSTTAKPEPRISTTTSSSTSTTVAPTTTAAPTTAEPPTTAPPTTKAPKPAPPAAEPAPNQDCTPGYDPCIPPGSDVDCAGGSGDGPRYVEGPVYVTGPDVYKLDRDGDGVACES